VQAQRPEHVQHAGGDRRQAHQPHRAGDVRASQHAHGAADPLAARDVVHRAARGPGEQGAHAAGEHDERRRPSGGRGDAADHGPEQRPADRGAERLADQRAPVLRRCVDDDPGEPAGPRAGAPDALDEAREVERGDVVEAAEGDR
jgi:hypothetical protein